MIIYSMIITITKVPLRFAEYKYISFYFIVKKEPAKYFSLKRFITNETYFKLICIKIRLKHEGVISAYFLSLQAEKDFRSKQLIREAIMENDFLKNLPSQQVREIVDYMEKKKVVAGAYVIKEGDTGKTPKRLIVVILNIVSDALGIFII